MLSAAKHLGLFLQSYFDLLSKILTPRVCYEILSAIDKMTVNEVLNNKRAGKPALLY